VSASQSAPVVSGETRAADTLESVRSLVGGAPLLKDEIVILTGAAGGIGQVIARVLGAAGARLGLIDVDGTDLDSLGQELQAGGAVTVAAHLDAADGASLEGFLDKVEAELGPVSGLVNCAGLWAPASYDRIDERSWRATIDANLQTAFIGCVAVLPGMVRHRRGSIVNFASTAGEYGSIRAAAHYAAAKGGVIGLTKSLAREVGSANVRVNAVSPGPIDTAALIATDAERTQIAERTLLGRLGAPEEIACACTYLLSPLSSFVTGHVLRVNGGSLL
jgi:NAD(P)-dependent dehydrogenase (short-subunit alcohol dehydrogenase family)